MNTNYLTMPVGQELGAAELGGSGSGSPLRLQPGSQQGPHHLMA